MNVELAQRAYEAFNGAFPDYTIEVEELRGLGDVTLGQIRGRATLPKR
jgi:adenine-specific DNA glycosylase